MEINKELIKKYNQAGPRYTSYPPATFFNEKYSADNYLEDIAASNHDQPQNISLYVHIPFCPRLCHFCGCNTMISQKEEQIHSYISALKREIEMVAANLDLSRPVTQIHWGGGTPNSISLSLIEEVMEQFHYTFKIAPHAEIAMECSPAYLSPEDISRLVSMGFNRLSLGIQDFNEDVLKIVNRKSSKYPVEQLVDQMRAVGLKGINFDFIYGLPGQTTESFAETIKKAVSYHPHRLVTFSYAHVPWVKKAQQILEKTGLPGPEEKMEMLETSMHIINSSGYETIGMDHYALPDDPLSIARKNNKLHRNFQGYCTRETTGQVYAFGTSSISQLERAYCQNEKDLNAYISRIGNGELPIARGYRTFPSERIIRHVINEVMCNGRVDLEQVATLYNHPVDDVIRFTTFEPDKFAEMAEDGLLGVDDKKLTVSPAGMMVVRNIAMKLDPLLETSQARYSKTV